MGSRRVLAIIPGLSDHGGAEQSLVAVTPDVCRAGIELHIALLSTERTLAPVVEAAGATVHDLSGPGGVLSTAKRIRGLVRTLDPDLVHASLFEASLPAQLASLGTRVPVLVTWAGMPYAAERRNEAEVSWPKLQALRVVDSAAGHLSRSRYHAVTDGVGHENARSLGIPRSRVFVGERGRDVSRYRITGANAESLRADLGLDPASRVILAVGRQDPQKGYEVLLDAFEQVAGTHPDARLLIAGRTGGATPKLERHLATLEHQERVTFLGQRDDVPQLLALADVIACSSWREGAAGALLEAMAAGTPIVCVPLRGLDGILVDGVNALVVERDRLAEGLLRMLDEDELARSLAERARTDFESRFTVERSAARLVEIYCAVARTPAP